MSTYVSNSVCQNNISYGRNGEQVQMTGMSSQQYFIVGIRSMYSHNYNFSNTKHILLSITIKCLSGIFFKVVAITSSVAKINFAVSEITFIVAVITFSVDKINFVVPEITFKVAVFTSSVDKITFAVTELTLLGADIRFLVAKITFVAAEVTFKVDVTISSVTKLLFNSIG